MVVRAGGFIKKAVGISEIHGLDGVGALIGGNEHAHRHITLNGNTVGSVKIMSQRHHFKFLLTFNLLLVTIIKYFSKTGKYLVDIISLGLYNICR